MPFLYYATCRSLLLLPITTVTGHAITAFHSIYTYAFIFADIFASLFIADATYVITLFRYAATPYAFRYFATLDCHAAVIFAAMLMLLFRRHAIAAAAMLIISPCRHIAPTFFADAAAVISSASC